MQIISIDGGGLGSLLYLCVYVSTAANIIHGTLSNSLYLLGGVHLRAYYPTFPAVCFCVHRNSFLFFCSLKPFFFLLHYRITGTPDHGTPIGRDCSPEWPSHFAVVVAAHHLQLQLPCLLPPAFCSQEELFSSYVWCTAGRRMMLASIGVSLATHKDQFDPAMLLLPLPVSSLHLEKHRSYAPLVFMCQTAYKNEIYWSINKFKKKYI